MRSSPTETDQSAWSVVLPVKRLSVAKSRLDLAAHDRERLAAAMAADTVAAALSAPSVARVVVVTDDELAAGRLRALGAVVVPDVPDAGLNLALAHGIEAARSTSDGGPVATLSADLPALTGEALDAALRIVRRLAVVADSEGTGTTLLAAAAGVEVNPEYGPGSFARHRASGADDITSEVAQRLRLDVDTLDDLQAAIALGVGSNTTAVVADFGWVH